MRRNRNILLYTILTLLLFFGVSLTLSVNASLTETEIVIAVDNSQNLIKWGSGKSYDNAIDDELPHKLITL